MNNDITEPKHTPVKRYDPVIYPNLGWSEWQFDEDMIKENELGDYVLYDDYDKLERERNELREALKQFYEVNTRFGIGGLGMEEYQKANAHSRKVLFPESPIRAKAEESFCPACNCRAWDGADNLCDACGGTGLAKAEEIEPVKYRMLGEGEVVLEGDGYRFNDESPWEPVKKISVGNPLRRRNVGYFRRPIAADEIEVGACDDCKGSGLGKAMYRPEIDKTFRDPCYTCKGTGRDTTASTLNTKQDES